jgi:hypothetical protein
LNDKWEPCYVITSFFEITKTFGNAMGLQVNEMLAKHGFNVEVITYFKDEGNNISTMIIIMTSVI